MDQVKYLKLEKHVKNGTIRSNGGGGKRFSILKYSNKVPSCTLYIFFENLSNIMITMVYDRFGIILYCGFG